MIYWQKLKGPIEIFFIMVPSMLLIGNLKFFLLLFELLYVRIVFLMFCLEYKS